jgi:hypothetical protein
MRPGGPDSRAPGGRTGLNLAPRRLAINKSPLPGSRRKCYHSKSRVSSGNPGLTVVISSGVTTHPNRGLPVLSCECSNGRAYWK